MKKNRVHLSIGLIMGLTFAFIFFPSLITYPVAIYQYEKLVEANPQVKNTVEKSLFLYRSQTIDIKDSLWGKATTLKDGEYCQQYLILNREPIDVIYDSEERVLRIFSSFE